MENFSYWLSWFYRIPSCKRASFKRKIFGLDNLNDYYDTDLKARLNELDLLSKELNAEERYKFFEVDISDNLSLENIFKENNFDMVINLAPRQEYDIQ